MKKLRPKNFPYSTVDREMDDNRTFLMLEDGTKILILNAALGRAPKYLVDGKETLNKLEVPKNYRRTVLKLVSEENGGIQSGSR